MTCVVKFDGSPGAGKTTKLRERAQEHADTGVELDEVLYLTFTRAGREDAAEALGEAYPEATEEELAGHARTFHSAALRACYDAGAMDPEDAVIITPDEDSPVYERFAAAEGLCYKPEKAGRALDPDRTPTADLPLGNRFFAAAEWLALRYPADEDFRSAPVSLSLQRAEATRLFDAWERYKATGGPSDYGTLYEHHDYVALAVERELTPDVRVLFIDEFQDLSPLEYALFKGWRESGRLDTIYIAGDPNQAIYGFRGATPWFFENTPVDEAASVTLKESYRVCRRPARVARGILDAHDLTHHDGFRAHADADDGAWETLTAPSAATLTDEVAAATREHGGPGPSTFILARTNRHVAALKKHLRDAGIPHKQLGAERQVWTAHLGQVYRALEAARTGAKAPVDDVRAFLDYAARADSNDYIDRISRMNAVWSGAADTDSLLYPAEVVQAAIPDVAAAFDLLPRKDAEDDEKDGFHDWQLSALRTALEAGHGFGVEQVMVGTIHSSKGLEAPTCVLFGDVSAAVRDSYSADPATAAEEHRLFYVGATRASETLYVVTDFFDGPTFPGFEPVIPTAEWVDAGADADPDGEHAVVEGGGRR